MKRAYLHDYVPRLSHVPSDIEELRKVFDYDKETGIIRWKLSTVGGRRRINVGDIAGYLSRGVLTVCYKHKNYLGHRLAWALVTGEWPPEGFDIDHKNRNPSDSRWTNLRLATRGQNNFNSVKRGGNTGVRGVYKHNPGKNWFARIYVDGERIHLGTFNTFEDAVAARQIAEQQYYPGLKE